ncbi:MAG: TonB-dependent receptor [Phenylobacterium sp.]|uniref:TonB-dependent receptor domain-containing protein n=1 Tax=Phenylobacterium sp. TaxID=1871053 RepID=UPI001A564D26|nr:TonB-dependent receptor [Phenylobacterium sp.]MBL8555384.1 TonB-dependent receptor [Phenylobacterium sp.]
MQPLRRYGGDELWSYEAGARWQSPRLGLTARLAAFQADCNDIQADLLLPSGLPFTADLGVGRSRGIEAEAKWSRGGLELGGNLTAQEPELRRPAPGLPARADSGLPGVPRVSFVAFAAYAQDLDADWRFSTRASYAYVGASRLVFDAVTAPRMGGYGDLRLSLTLTSPAMSVGLFAENLLDRRGDTLAYGNPFLLRRQVLSTPQRPRTVGLAVGRNF